MPLKICIVVNDLEEADVIIGVVGSLPSVTSVEFQTPETEPFPIPLSDIQDVLSDKKQGIVHVYARGYDDSSVNGDRHPTDSDSSVSCDDSSSSEDEDDWSGFRRSGRRALTVSEDMFDALFNLDRNNDPEFYIGIRGEEEATNDEGDANGEHQSLASEPPAYEDHDNCTDGFLWEKLLEVSSELQHAKECNFSLREELSEIETEVAAMALEVDEFNSDVEWMAGELASAEVDLEDAEDEVREWKSLAGKLMELLVRHNFLYQDD